MKHFTQEQWLLYKKGMISREIMDYMDSHLQECDQCLQTFLALIGEQEILNAGKILSPDFTKHVLQEAGQLATMKQKKRKSNEGIKTTMIYYAAAASITLLFAVSGVFQTFVEKAPLAVSNQIVSVLKEDSLKPDLSAAVVNKAAAWIQNFETRGEYNEKK